MKTYYCQYCKVYALAVNYRDSIPICMCGLEMEESE